MRRKPTTFDEQNRRARDARKFWDAAQPAHGDASIVPSRGSVPRARAARGSRAPRQFARRGRLTTNVMLSLVAFSAAVSVGLLFDAVRRANPGQGVPGANGSPAAAERARISVFDPAQSDDMEEDETEPRIMRFITGIDVHAHEMTDAEIFAELNDPMATLVLRRGVFPATIDDTLNALNAHNASPSGLPTQAVYLVGEGGQIQHSQAPPDLKREMRFAITRQRGSNVDLLISVGAGGEPTGFIQIISWDSTKNAFNYYERRGSATWVWLGDSGHSLREATRGKGCFKCHVNGAPVMKELRLPWNNWHSQNATISPSILAPDDPLRTNRLFLDSLNGGFGAQDLQRFAIEPGVRRWNSMRVRKMIAADGTISDVPLLLRQLFETTTINLASSGVQSKSVQPSATFVLPLTFFVNRDALFNVLKLNPEVELPKVSGEFYLSAVERFQLAIADTSINFSQPGDTFFAFMAPEPSFEDFEALRQMLEKKIVTPKFAACVLMIDFQNPVYSERRQHLARYIPDTGMLQGGASDVPARFVERVTQAAQALPPDSPEQEFLANWNLPDDQWQSVFRERVRSYLTAVNGRLSAQEGFDAYMRLAVSRRREFEASPASFLAEFPLLLPTSNVPSGAPSQRMNPDGSVSDK